MNYSMEEPSKLDLFYLIWEPEKSGFGSVACGTLNPNSTGHKFTNRSTGRGADLPPQCKNFSAPLKKFFFAIFLMI